MITELKSVNNVIQNVSLVSMLLLVLLVKVTEDQLVNVHVHTENSLIVNGIVNHVHTIVKLVKISPENVNFVTETELTLTIVLVLTTTSMMVPLPPVKCVPTDVPPVPPVIPVPLVLKEDLEVPVLVQPEKLNNVPLPVLTCVTVLVIDQSVPHVPFNVENVKTEAHLIVQFVLETELMPMFVTVQMLLSKTELPPVHHVPQNVLLVKPMLILVSLVLKEELIQMPDVHVLKDHTSTFLNNIVDLVESNVPPVPKKIPVSFVLIIPESKELFVTVKMVSMKMELLNVQLVKKNVISVLTVHPTVLFVLQEESMHQNVLSHHQPLKPLELTMSQLVLLKFICNNRCVTCERTADNCETCDVNRSNPPSCVCNSGFYEENEECKHCSYKCITCHSLTDCITCSHSRRHASSCDCEDGYFDAGVEAC
jgi:hypothetical protein